MKTSTFVRLNRAFIKHCLVKCFRIELTFFAILLITGCPNPLEPTFVDKVKDKIDPVITLLSPKNNSSYSSSITITGKVTDKANDDGENGMVESFTYEIIGTKTNGEIKLKDDGDFKANISTKDLNGEIEIEFTATDWNDNSSTETLKLTDDEAGPYIEITSPEDQSNYSSLVIVQGRVANSSSDSGTGEIKSLAYEILASSINGDLDFDNGTFSFQFTTETLTGNQV